MQISKKKYTFSGVGFHFLGGNAPEVYAPTRGKRCGFHSGKNTGHLPRLEGAGYSISQWRQRAIYQIAGVHQWNSSQYFAARPKSYDHPLRIKTLGGKISFKADNWRGSR
jgi:hypothetical protein